MLFTKAPGGADAETPFTLGDALADALRAEYGVVHRTFPDVADSYNDAANSHPDRIDEYGLSRVADRTYFGKTVVDLFGKDVLQGVAVTRPNGWGGLTMDLVDEPWRAAAADLVEAQSQVMKQLEPSGLFARREGVSGMVAGPRWKAKRFSAS